MSREERTREIIEADIALMRGTLRGIENGIADLEYVEAKAILLQAHAKHVLRAIDWCREGTH